MSIGKTLNYEPTGGNLVVSEMKNWKIGTPNQATTSEQYAAEEFQRLFKPAIQLALPLETIDEPNNDKDQVTIMSLSSLDEEEISIIVDQSYIQISGGLPRGVLYAVYQFLEELIGIRFITSDHTFIPDDSEMQIPCGIYTYNPPFSFRWSYYRENSNSPEFAAKRKVNTITDAENLGGKTQQNLINHSFHFLVPFNLYGEDHPEYYALHEGERDTDTHGGGPQLCVTNADVIEIAANTAIQHLTDNPNISNISVSQADTARYCRCDTCEELNQAEDSPMGSQLTFVNAVAERIEKVHPNVSVGTLAYWYTRQAPKTVRPLPNVQIQLCSIECCTFHAIDNPDCEKNQAFCSDTIDWGKICNDIWIWNYNTNFRCYDLPHPNLRCIGPNVRYFLRNNAKGVFMQANGNGLTGEFSDLRNYLISQLIWNPHLNEQEILSEFVELHYEDAASAIMDYIDFLHDNVETKGLHPGTFPSPADVGLDGESSRRIFEFFDEALKLAPNSEIKARVEKASIPAYKAMIVAGGIDGIKRRNTVAEYIALCNRYGMTHAAEHQTAEDYFEQLQE
ncbi:hypothetical protein C6497_01400 [Candidatus Poribacteria bacterium]|nr:MAG: hypothetical protein C6497_01400 [Candidatus Poribacteria bacterium]